MNQKKHFNFNLIFLVIFIFFSISYIHSQELPTKKKTENKILKNDIDNDGDLDIIEVQHNNKTQVILSVHVNNGNDTYKKSRKIGFINNVTRDVDYQVFKDKYKRTLILFGKKHNGNEINLNNSRLFRLPKF